MGGPLRDDAERLRIGVVGLGRAFSAMGPNFLNHPDVRLTAAADPNTEARARFEADFGLPTYAHMEEMCAAADVDALYIASPHQFHCAHVCAAAARGKHVLLEKPMALTLGDCDAMNAAVDRAGIALVVGHTHAFDPPLRMIRDYVADGRYGPLRMINLWTFTDFLYRPRRPEELDTRLGGGIIYNQLPHQVDMVRYVGGGLIKSVNARIGVWDRTRPTEGASVVMFEFEDGCFGSMTYGGYAHFDTAEFNDWIGETGSPVDRGGFERARKNIRSLGTPEAEARHKQQTGFAGRGLSLPKGAFQHQSFGVFIASCERADLRHLPQGVGVYADNGNRVVPVSGGRGAGNRSAVIDELVDAVRGVRPAVHDGAWAKATLEVCLAVLDSGRRRLEVSLRHQVGLDRGPARP